jgi:hypothetical protein
MRYSRFLDGSWAALASLCAGSRAYGLVSVAIAVALPLGMASPADAQAPAASIGSPSATPATSSAAGHPYAAHVAEASRRFGIPEAWIWSVMRVESAGNPSATSHAGAMGLMQVMPGTYAELRSRYGLGPNAYDPRDSILAGAAYLREMHDRYGSAGFLAAYNAGPGRWEDYVSRGRPLPAETVAYMARLGPMVGSSAAPSPTSWRRSTASPGVVQALFVALDRRTSGTVPVASSPRDETPPPTTSDVSGASSSEQATSPEITPAQALFAVRRPE